MSLKIECRKHPKLPSAAEALSYRLAMAVTRHLPHPGGSTYPLCPRCDRCLDREYLMFCNCCGQRLSWKRFR